MNVRHESFLKVYVSSGGKISKQDQKLLDGIGWHFLNRGKGKIYANRRVNGDKKNCYPLHRKIMSLIIKRELESNEIVIHLDGDYLNNRRSNLKLLSNKSI